MISKQGAVMGTKSCDTKEMYKKGQDISSSDVYKKIKAAKGTKGTLPEGYPEYWKWLSDVTSELAQLRPVLENGTVTENIFTVQSPLAAQTRVYKKYAYTILINRSDKEVAVPTLVSKRKYKLLFGQKKTDTISPYGVWIIKNRK